MPLSWICTEEDAFAKSTRCRFHCIIGTNPSKRVVATISATVAEAALPGVNPPVPHGHTSGHIRDGYIKQCPASLSYWSFCHKRAAVDRIDRLLSSAKVGSALPSGANARERSATSFGS